MLEVVSLDDYVVSLDDYLYEVFLLYSNLSTIVSSCSCFLMVDHLQRLAGAPPGFLRAMLLLVVTIALWWHSNLDPVCLIAEIKHSCLNVLAYCLRSADESFLHILCCFCGSLQEDQTIFFEQSWHLPHRRLPADPNRTCSQ